MAPPQQPEKVQSYLRGHVIIVHQRYCVLLLELHISPCIETFVCSYIQVHKLKAVKMYPKGMQEKKTGQLTLAVHTLIAQTHKSLI